MEQEITLMLAALEKIGYNHRFHREAARTENLEVLNTYFRDWPLQEFFLTYSFDEAVEIGLIWYNQVNCFKKELTWDEYFARCIVSQLLPIGTGLNGDPIVVDANDLKVGFLHHDRLWEEDGIMPRDWLVKMDCSIGQFYFNAANDEEYPVDAYSARDYMDSKKV